MYVNCIQRLLVIGLKIYFKVLKEGFKFQNNDIIYLLEKNVIILVQKKYYKDF